MSHNEHYLDFSPFSRSFYVVAIYTSKQQRMFLNTHGYIKVVASEVKREVISQNNHIFLSIFK